MNEAPRAPEPGEFVPPNYFRRLHSEELFTRPGPLEIDLGCGDGSFVLALARHYPDRNFLAVERLLGRVRKVCRRAQHDGLENLKVLRLEALYTVEWLLPLHSVSRLHLLFPDPWPKARHHRRRLVQQDFLIALQRILRPGGEFLFKTDHEDYFEWACEEVNQSAHFTVVDWPEEAFFYPQTDFESQWRAEGREVYRLRAVGNEKD